MNTHCARTQTPNSQIPKPEAVVLLRPWCDACSGIVSSGSDHLAAAEDEEGVVLVAVAEAVSEWQW